MARKFLMSVFFLCLVPTAWAGEPTLLWTAKEGLLQPESVVYDSERDLLYVSNVNGDPALEDGNGFISKIEARTGKVQKAEWLTGLNAPKGLGLRGDLLYIADVKQLVVMNVATGTLVRRYEAPQAKFLNDVATGPDGSVYISDMLDNAIYRLKHGVFRKWLASPALESPNGLYAERLRLVVGSWGVLGQGFATQTPGRLLSVPFLRQKPVPVGNMKPCCNLDGIVSDQKGGFYATDYMAGQLLYFGASGNQTVLASPGQGAADLTYLIARRWLAVPMLQNNELRMYKVN